MEQGRTLQLAKVAARINKMTIRLESGQAKRIGKLLDGIEQGGGRHWLWAVALESLANSHNIKSNQFYAWANVLIYKKNQKASWFHLTAVQNYANLYGKETCYGNYKNDGKGAKGAA
jgi:hypothetical protein